VDGRAVCEKWLSGPPLRVYVYGPRNNAEQYWAIITRATAGFPHPSDYDAAHVFGHTYDQGCFQIKQRGKIDVINPHLPRGLVLDPLQDLVNPDSVGQPRDRDPDAAYAINSPQERRIEFRRVAYDAKAAGKKLFAAGLPERLASRLLVGV
jgi:hypothetical protein